MSTFAQGLGKRSEQILLALRHDIDRGVYTKEKKLPTEGELCKRFDASRPTVRRAIARLVEEGKVVVRQGSGMYVNGEPSAPAAGKTIGIMYEFSGDMLTQVQDHALGLGFLISVYSQGREHWNVQAERRFFEIAMAEKHRAVLAFCSPIEPRNDDSLQQLEDSGCRVIHIEHYRIELPEQHYRMPDYTKAGHMGAVQLMLAGYKRQILVRSNLVAPSSKLMEIGFGQAMREHNGEYVPERDTYCSPQGGHQEPGLSKIRKFWASLEPGTGLLFEGQHVGQFYLRSLREMGVKVPDDIGLMSIGPVVHAREHGDLDALEWNRLSMLNAALDLAAAPALERTQTLLPPTLIRRGTVRRP